MKMTSMRKKQKKKKKKMKLMIKKKKTKKMQWNMKGRKFISTFEWLDDIDSQTLADIFCMKNRLGGVREKDR